VLIDVKKKEEKSQAVPMFGIFCFRTVKRNMILLAKAIFKIVKKRSFRSMRMTRSPGEPEWDSGEEEDDGIDLSNDAIWYVLLVTKGANRVFETLAVIKGSWL